MVNLFFEEVERKMRMQEVMTSGLGSVGLDNEQMNIAKLLFNKLKEMEK
jgi:hypothetical protein